MPVEFGVWRLLGDKATSLAATSMPDEKRLEDLLVYDIDILGLGVMVVGRQIPTAAGGYIDVLAIDADGDLHVIELKRDRTPRDVVAQVLDYASWVKDLSYEDIRDIWARNGPRRGLEFEVAYDERFGESPDENLNKQHHLVIVASELDPSTERIVTYLTEEYGVPVNAVFFRYFADVETGAEYLARSWLIDPTEVEVKSSRVAGRRPPWNGHDYYVTFGPPQVRAWEDGRQYGFVSASGGPRWIKPLFNLALGDRVFVLAPGHGYVGVGIVRERAVPITDFEVNGTPLLQLPLKSPRLDEHLDDPEAIEHVVRVEWIKAVPEPDGYWEKGMFAVPNSVCQLRQQFTLEKVIEHFDIPPYEPS
ncbi:MAG: DUF91 domain-containing protein [Actinobacteria bacterium]|nr:DUF91 domain-containing protein [Actinomycetota bacterium]